MLLQGGDTDTNAAIVGGLIGACRGLKSIDRNYVTALLAFNVPKGGTDKSKQGIPRPMLLIPQNNLVTNLEKIYKNAPTKLEI